MKVLGEHCHNMPGAGKHLLVPAFKRMPGAFAAATPQVQTPTPVGHNKLKHPKFG